MCVVFGYSRTQCFSTKLSYLYIQSKNACTHLALLYAFSTPKNRRFPLGAQPRVQHALVFAVGFSSKK